MTKLICLRFVILLVGLVWPVYGQDTDDIWLNEIYVDYDTALRLSVELVGRPKDRGADAPRQMSATLRFFGPHAESAGEELNIALTPNADWGQNYLTTELNKLGYQEAFPQDEIAGAVLAYTAQGEEVRKIYCWGEGADGSSTIDGGRKTCDAVVRPTTMYVSEDGESRGSGLYGGTEGEAESAFIWGASTTEGGGEPSDFSTIGQLNACGNNHCTHGDQAIKEWSFTDVTEVWLNEVDFENGEVSIEMVARPAEPADVSVSVRFYLGDEAQGAATTATLVPDSNFAANYALHTAVTGVAEAFPSTGALAGLVLTGDSSVPIVYCWGTDAAANDASIGEEFPCGRTVRSTAFSDDSFNSALYNKEAGGAEGLKGKDFKWEESKHNGGASFSTLGDINSCTDACALETQVLAPYVRAETPNEDQVWLNELDVLGHASDPTKASLEFVGRPVWKAGEAPPPSISVNVKFYGGSGEVGSGVAVLLEQESEDLWEGNYKGVIKDDTTHEGAFHGALGGVQVEYENETRVYCWGANAALDVAIDGSNVECDTVVTATTIPGDGRTNIAMYNDRGTPDDGGAKGADFNWAESVDGNSEAFHTIGEVNVCPDGSCVDPVVDQQLAKFEWADSTPESDNDDVVWLNELDVVGHLDSPICMLEFVGRPVRVNGEDPPASIEAVVTFYDGSAEIGDAVTVTLTSKSQDKWEGNYVGSFKDDSATARYSAAFPREDKVTGVKVVHGEETRVYCWGLNAKVDDAIDGAQVKCQSIVTSTNINGEDGQTNFAMWNKADNSTPSSGGTKGDDFEWQSSQYATGGAFDTIDAVNACPTDQACGDLKNQVLAKYDWTVNDVVWINEVCVDGALESANPSVSIEFAARPTRRTGNPPSSIQAKLTFYDGKDSMDEMSVTLSPQSSNGWKGNYVGVKRDDETLSKAFPRGGIGGVKVVYEHEARVYCWGDDAEVGSVVGDITTKCEVVVSDEEMNVSEEQRNMAMWNRDGAAYEGRGGGDFQWERSVDDEGEDFATIGEVNVCSACGDLNDQVLAEFDWKAVETPPPSSTTASTAVARRGVTAVGLAGVFMFGVL